MQVEQKPKLSERGVELAGALAAVKDFIDGKVRNSSHVHRYERVHRLAQRLKVDPAFIRKIANMKDPAELGDYILSMEGRHDELTDAIEHLNTEIDALKAERDGPAMAPALQLSDALAQARAHQATPTFDRNRPWMEAIEQQYAALTDIDAAINRQPLFFPDAPADIRDSWKLDRYLLRRAECYTWGAEALAACRAAARTIPHSTVLRADMLPSQAPGWWYFPGPIPVKTTSWDEGMIALLYGWTDLPHGGRAMTFTTYVIGREPGNSGRLRHVPMGSQMWQWEEGHTFRQLMDSVGAGYDADTKEREPFMAKRNVRPMPREDFIRAAAEVSLFFLAACAWMQQRVVTMGSGHIERHRRKQLARERMLDAPPTDVKIVQLRRVEQQETRPAAAGGDPVDWSCRWVVNGHWRNQAHGTKHGERRLIYILPYVKGPDDKPLKQPQHTVYVVNR